MTLQIGIIVGSLRRESLNRRLAHALIRIGAGTDAPNMEIVEIGHLPHCNADDEDDPPASILAFKRRIESLDAFLFVTPEYNRGVPGVLKNAIDIASRPYGHNSWAGKPVGVISASPGAIGGFGANHQLRQCFVFLDMPALQQPEAYIGNADVLFDDQGDLADDSTISFLADYLKAFTAWTIRHHAS
jgi:chromate reductase